MTVYEQCRLITRNDYMYIQILRNLNRPRLLALASLTYACRSAKIDYLIMLPLAGLGLHCDVLKERTKETITITCAGVIRC